MNSNEDKPNIKIVANNTFYNFVVENFFTLKSSGVPKYFFLSS